ncbi:MAG: hypothetical protein JWO19_5923, partial [Bryobacterales bacterium]|nr:hypothetical protein [Bryobacterales bacterium]
MAIYILNADNDARRGTAIEKRLRDITAHVIKIERIEDVARTAAPKPGERTYIVVIVPADNKTYVK